MKTRTLRALSLGAGLALLAVGPAVAQTPNFTKYVAIGDSYGAGYTSGCVVGRDQQFSYPATLARQFGISGFQQPTVSDPGHSDLHRAEEPRACVTFGPISTKTGAPTNLPSRAPTTTCPSRATRSPTCRTP